MASIQLLATWHLPEMYRQHWQLWIQNLLANAVCISCCFCHLSSLDALASAGCNSPIDCLQEWRLLPPQ